ncbi:MAG: hypothetical protein OEZ43_08485 [Gammaproteobacteria bacterium]|nr:hypothetical protein [Gammaproteobacteria bacterium]
MQDEIKDLILEHAISAPSADNSQPWKFHWNGEILEIHIDETRSGGPSDKSFLLSDMSIGALIENISQTSFILGYKDKITLFPRGVIEAPFYTAQIEFHKDDQADIDLQAARDRLQFIRDRHTDRSFPWKEIPAETKESLASLCEDIPGTDIIWLNRQEKKTARQAMWQAESLRFSTKELHSELFSSIRFDIGWKNSTKEGLAPASLNVEWFARPVFSACRRWSLMRMLNLIGAAKGFGFRSAYLPNLLSPELVAICTSGDSRQAIICGARTMQRFWLLANKKGLSIQPFAAPSVIYLAKEIPVSENKSSKIKEKLAALNPNMSILILLRAGLSSTPKPGHTSLRRGLSDF